MITDQASLSHEAIIDLESRHASGVYGKREIAFVRGQGARLWDADGREYIDCSAAYGVANAGHAHPHIVAAIAAQAETLISCPEFVYNDVRARFQERLAALLPGDLTRIYLCNSGAEANEAAIKFARLSTGRSEIVAMTRGFHGRTLGALSATYKSAYKTPFEPLVPGFSHVPFNNIERLAEAVGDGTAAILMEVVQGEGGVHPADYDFLRAARELCDRHGALLIFDEVQTGFGRTGRWFACQHAEVFPDLIALGKSIGGGLPMGAVGIGQRVKNLAPGMHGSTFGGNPLVCAAALANLDVLGAEDLVGRSAREGERFMTSLRNLSSPLIRDVRGLGLMIGLELKTRVMPILKDLQARGVVALPAGTTVLRFLPPLVVTEDQLSDVLVALAEALDT